MVTSRDRTTDEIIVTFLHLNTKRTTQGILQKLFLLQSNGNSNTHLTCRKVNLSKLLGTSWDQPPAEAYQKKSINWETSLPPKTTVPREFQQYQETIEAINLQVFGNVSVARTTAAIYVIIYQPY